jgi:hypothetical protein
MLTRNTVLRPITWSGQRTQLPVQFTQTRTQPSNLILPRCTNIQKRRIGSRNRHSNPKFEFAPFRLKAPQLLGPPVPFGMWCEFESIWHLGALYLYLDIVYWNRSCGLAVENLRFLAKARSLRCRLVNCRLRFMIFVQRICFLCTCTV